jgi:hypothetical protein
VILFVPFGPRLDLSDGVGDTGRPRAAALFVATLVAGAGLAATAHLAGLGSSANLAATGAGFAVAGVALFARERPLVRAGAHLLFLPGVVLATLGVASGVLASDPVAGVGVTLGVALAVGGGAAAWAGLLGDGEATEAVRQGLLAAAVPVVVAVPLLLVAGTLAVLSGTLGGVVLPGGARPRPAGLALLAGATAGALRLALGVLPLARLAERERRAATEAALARARRGLTVAAGVGLVAWVGLGVAGLVGVLDGLWAALPPALVRGLALATGGVVRVPVALTGAVALVLATGAALARRLSGGSEWLGTGGLPFVGGAVLLVVVSPALVVLAAARVDEPLTVGLSVVLVVLATVALSVLVGVALLAAGTLPLAARVGLLPARAGGVALLAAGTLLVAAAGGLAGAPTPAVAGTVAAAVVAWDLGGFATALTREVGARPAVRALSRRRALGSVGVGVAGWGLALGVDRVGGASSVGLLPAAALAALGLVAVALLLRA